MKTNLGFKIGAWVVVVAGLALLNTGCIHHERRASAPVERSSLAMRLEAAQGMTFLTERDEALGSVARDAAHAGDAAMTKDALQRMTFLQTRDAAAGDCALELSEAGQHSAALEVARLILSLQKRDAVLKKLAMGGKAEGGK